MSTDHKRRRCPMRRPHLRRARWGGLALAITALALATALSLVVGARPVPPGAVADAFLRYDPSIDDQYVVRQLRVPRLVAGLLAGPALGLAGALSQGLTRNPMADPGLLGVNAGAALAAVLGIHLGGVTTLSGYVWLSFVGAAVAGAAVVVLGGVGRPGAGPTRLVLAGAALTALLTSATTAVLVRDVATLERYRFWAVGALAGRDLTMARQTLPFLAVGAVMALAIGRPLGALALGDDAARGLGARVGRTRGVAAASIVVLVGAATALAGPIAFVGLAVPHLARALAGPDQAWTLRYAAVLAPTLLLVADVAGRVVAAPGEVQAGVMVALVGGPWFVVLAGGRRAVRT